MIPSLIDANDSRFLAPMGMAREVRKACAETDQQIPEGIFQIAAVIYNSLAQCYADTVKEIEEITGITYPAVNLVGGGSNADYLNILTAKACRKPVFAGPSEATAIGNIVCQMLASGELEDLSSARECIGHSFDVVKYEF